MQEIGFWHSHGGDPTALGWTITFGYLITAAACLRNALRARASSLAPESIHPWRWLAAGTLFLGLNKQLDLQTLLIRIGRAVSLSENWYQDRRLAELLFMFVFAIVSILLLRYGIRSSGGFATAHPDIVIGVGLVLLYCLVRAAEITHAFFGPAGERLTDTWLWVLEPLGLGLILMGALRDRRRLRAAHC